MWEPRICIQHKWADGWTDGLTNLTGAFRDYANAPHNTKNFITACLTYTPGSTKRLRENTTNLENLEQNSV
jgi:hypothetical protein